MNCAVAVFDLIETEPPAILAEACNEAFFSACRLPRLNIRLVRDLGGLCKIAEYGFGDDGIEIRIDVDQLGGVSVESLRVTLLRLFARYYSLRDNHRDLLHGAILLTLLMRAGLSQHFTLRDFADDDERKPEGFAWIWREAESLSASEYSAKACATTLYERIIRREIRLYDRETEHQARRSELDDARRELDKFQNIVVLVGALAFFAGFALADLQPRPACLPTISKSAL